MRSCAFLTMADPTGFVIDDDLAHVSFASEGWRVEPVAWTQDDRPWSFFDAVVVRSTWDYHLDRSRFLAVLGRVVAAGVPLFNPLPLIQWNLSKTYLLELAARGVTTVPTAVLDSLEPDGLEALFDTLGDDEIVVKPVVGANAMGAYRIPRAGWREQAPAIEARYAATALLAQPFARAVLSDGEYSLFYFNGEYSHAVVKRPAPGDYRVQEEHGATIRSLEPAAGLRNAGDAAVRALPEAPLYARVDLVRANNGEGFWLMELELIEPSLYLRMDAAAPLRFARAFAGLLAG